MLASEEKGGNIISALSVRINQGKTHQVRASMAFINCPIMGDDLYSRSYYEDEKKKKKDREDGGIIRSDNNNNMSFIHSFQLQFKYRLNDNKLYKIQAPIPNHWYMTYPAICESILSSLVSMEEEKKRKFEMKGKIKME